MKPSLTAMFLLDRLVEPQNNLVVILVSTQERQTGVYYGSQWEKELGASWTRIQADVMNPRFAQGDFAGGVIAGLQEINRLINAQNGGQTSTPGTGGASAGWIVLGVLLGFIVLIAVLLGIFLYRSSRKSRDRRLAIQQKALIAKQGAASKVNQLVETMQMLDIKVSGTAAKVAPEDAAPLLEGLSKTRNLVDQGAQRYSELGHSAGNPENPKMGETQLEVITQEYQKVLDILNQAIEEVNRVETALATFQEAIDGFSPEASGINATIESAHQKIDLPGARDIRLTSRRVLAGASDPGRG
jgi:uncharacterized membrane protein YgcG